MRKLLVGFILFMALPVVSMAEEQAPATPAAAAEAAPVATPPAAASPSVEGRVKANVTAPAVPVVQPSGYLPYNPPAAK